MWRTLKLMLDRAGAEAWQVIVAVALCLLLPALAALVLWPAGMAGVGLALLKGFGLFWLFVAVLFVLAAWVQRRLRVDFTRTRTRSSCRTCSSAASSCSAGRPSPRS